MEKRYLEELPAVVAKLTEKLLADRGDREIGQAKELCWKYQGKSEEFMVVAREQPRTLGGWPWEILIEELSTKPSLETVLEVYPTEDGVQSMQPWISITTRHGGTLLNKCLFSRANSAASRCVALG